MNDEHARPLSSSASSATLSSGRTANTNESVNSSSSSLATESPTSLEKPPYQVRHRSPSPTHLATEPERRVTFSSTTTNDATEASSHTMGVLSSKPPNTISNPSKSRPQRTWWRRFNRFPLANSLSALSLAVAAVGLLFFGWRQYRLQNMALAQSLIQNCQGWDESKLGSINSECEDLLRRFSDGEFKLPYPITKRASDGLRKRASELSASFLGHRQEDHAQTWTWVYSAIVVILSAVMLIVAAKFGLFTRIQSSLLLRETRRRPSDFHIATQQRLQGYSKACYDGRDYSVLRHQPSSHEDLHKLGHWLRSSASSSSSSVDSSASSELRRRSTQKRKLAIRHPTNDEEEAYDSLIELPSKKDTKIFFEPNTGAYIRLTPWKSQADDEENDDVQPGDTKGAIAKMGSGAVAFAAGKMVGEQIAEEIECFEEGRIREKMLPRATEGMQELVMNDGVSATKDS